MEKIALITDTTSDLTKEELAEHHIYAIPLQVTYEDGTGYRDSYEISIDKVIEDLPENFIRTSAPLAGDIIQVGKELLEKGYTHALAFPLSSGLSSTYSTMTQLSKQLESRIEVAIIDGKTVTMGIGYSLLVASKMIQEGHPFKIIVERMKELARNHQVFFAVPSLKYLHRGGRISRATKIAGDLLGIVPLITMNKEDGTLYTYSKARGEKKALRALVKSIEDYVGDQKPTKIFIAHTGNQAGIDFLKEELENLYPIEVTVHHLGSVLTVHTGPGLIGSGVFIK